MTGILPTGKLDYFVLIKENLNCCVREPHGAASWIVQVTVSRNKLQNIELQCHACAEFHFLLGNSVKIGYAISVQ